MLQCSSARSSCVDWSLHATSEVRVSDYVPREFSVPSLSHVPSPDDSWWCLPRGHEEEGTELGMLRHMCGVLCAPPHPTPSHKIRHPSIYMCTSMYVRVARVCSICGVRKCAYSA